MSEGLSNIKIDGEKLLACADILGMEKAREMVNEHKVKAFGLLSSILSRPKPEEIEIIYEEKRFDAFWHVLGTSRFEYKRRKKYTLIVDPIVQEVELLGSSFGVPGDMKTFTVEGVERCVEEYREEELVDAQTGQNGDFKAYLAVPNRILESTDEITMDGTPIVSLETKPSFLIRKVINGLIKPIQADQILDEQIGISELGLYFIPVYTFELRWKTKDKRVTISYDGVTGLMRPKANKITERLRRTFTNDELFEFGKEVANFVPGGGLAMMVGKKAIELTKKD